ncbi:sigma factor-like helix-turn-helix DNA-binding protein [Roseomonas genomospecies 6]|uniref:RNA polymerase sigma-70 region 4 domain-containing protein n=1 Tax=Roseomonas genomospecies 6 TaxID=214106 RepID=A0A9W7NIT5_9PROT|nr:sigma factor-like helix-turn-helix DNA-binding protein [Roseomonas genomospecies 6]KAA0679841.1 hypothetical protein DS843_15760 [Roseomonas genomospecies 6]
MTTLKEFEEALKTAGNTEALEILGKLRERDKAQRSIRPARRVVGKKMTPELAAQILELHRTTDMTQQEIAFQLGVNQGRVNEVIKRGKWLDGDPNAPEAIARDKAKARVKEGVGITPRPTRPKKKKAAKPAEEPPVTEAPAEEAPVMGTPVMETLAVETSIPEEPAPVQAESAPAPDKSEQPVPEKATKEKKKKRSNQPPAQLLFDGL